MANRDPYDLDERERWWREREARERSGGWPVGRAGEEDFPYDANRTWDGFGRDHLRARRRDYGPQHDRPWNRARQWRQNLPPPSNPAQEPLDYGYRGDPGLSPPRRNPPRRGLYPDPYTSGNVYPSAGMGSDFDPQIDDHERESDEGWVDYGEGDVGYDREGAFYQDLDEPINSRWNQPGKFTGMGPQNYQRSDKRIREEICERLSQHGRIDARGIEIGIQDGEVTLKGAVPNREMKWLAEDSIESIAGVKDVRNEIKVTSPGRRPENKYRQVEKNAPKPSSRPPDRGAQVYPTRAETRPTGISNPGAGATDQGVTPLSETEIRGDRQLYRSRLRKGMEVLGKNGKLIGHVKEVRADDFLIDRELSRDVYAPYSALESVGANALLNIASDEVEKQDWPKPALFF